MLKSIVKQTKLQDASIENIRNKACSPLELEGVFRPAGITRLDLGQRFLSLQIQGRNIDIKLQGSSPNSQILFWEINKQLIKDDLQKAGLSHLNDAVLLYVSKKLADRNRLQLDKSKLEHRLYLLYYVQRQHI